MQSKHADALVTLGSKIDFPGEAIDERVINNLRATLVDLILDNPFDQDWRHFIVQNFIHLQLWP